MKTLMIAAMMALGLQASAQTTNRNNSEQRRNDGGQRTGKTHMSAEQRAENQSRRMTKALNLDDRQQHAVYAANLDATRRMGPVKSQMRDAKKDARRIRHDRDQAMRNTLTVEQYNRMMQFKSKRHTARLERHNHGNRGRNMDRRNNMRHDDRREMRNNDRRNMNGDQRS